MHNKTAPKLILNGGCISPKDRLAKVSLAIRECQRVHLSRLDLNF